MGFKTCCGLRCIKTILQIFQVLFVITSVIIYVIGAWSFIKTYHITNILNSSTCTTTIYLFFSTGCLVIFVFILGCFAIPKHNTKLLFCYILLLVVIFLIEALVGVLSYIYRENIEEEVDKSFNTTILTTYKRDESKTESIDYIHQSLKCCGDNIYLDWRYSDWIANDTVINKVPDSCCKTMSDGCGSRDHPSNIFYEGCGDKIIQEVRLTLWLICAVSLGLSIVQVFGTIFGIVLFLQLESGKYDANYSPNNGNQTLLEKDDSYFQ